DVAQDRRERPRRPLPSGRVSRRAAGLLATALCVVGLASAALASVRPDRTAPDAASLAAVLVGAILLYDGWLKRTWAGPLAMGACRFLNVVLGVSLAEGVVWSRAVYLVGIVSCCIVRATRFARTEARASSRGRLAGAAAVMLDVL